MVSFRSEAVVCNRCAGRHRDCGRHPHLCSLMPVTFDLFDCTQNEWTNIYEKDAPPPTPPAPSFLLTEEKPGPAERHQDVIFLFFSVFNHCWGAQHRRHPSVVVFNVVHFSY